MDPRYFADYLKEFKRTGTLSVSSAMLVCHDDGVSEDEVTSDTAMGAEPNTYMGLQARPATPSYPEGRPERRSEAALTLPLEHIPLRLVFPITKRPGTAFDHISVGRTPNMDVVVPLSQISKFHAYFGRDTAGGFTLADAGSKNGTWIGRRRLAVRVPESVRDGDRVRIGASVFTFLTSEAFTQLLKKHARHWVEPMPSNGSRR